MSKEVDLITVYFRGNIQFPAQSRSHTHFLEYNLFQGFLVSESSHGIKDLNPGETAFRIQFNRYPFAEFFRCNSCFAEDYAQSVGLFIIKYLHVSPHLNNKTYKP